MDEIFRSRAKQFDETVESLSLHNVLIADSAPLSYDVLNKLDSMSLTEHQRKPHNEIFYERNDFFSNYFKYGSKQKESKDSELNKETLFSALVARKVPSKSKNEIEGVNLELPDLPSDTAHLKWQVPTSKEYEWINYAREFDKTSLNYTPIKQEADKKRVDAKQTEDEGFHSIKSSPSSRDDRLWDQIINYSLSDYIDWDMRKENKVLIRGLNHDKERQNKKYLLIDSPSHVFDQFYYYYLSTVYTVMGRKKTGRIVIDQKQYVYDCLNVLLSVQSSSFPFDKDQSRFQFNPRYHITGMSSEALQSYSEEYALTGTNHKLLLDFVDTINRHSVSVPVKTTSTFVEPGSVLRAFSNALKVYLNFFHRIVIQELEKKSKSVVSDDTNEFSIVSMYAHFKPYMNQIRFLVEICDLHPKSAASLSSSLNSIPKGLDLIFHLFKLTRETVNYTFKFHILVHLLSYCLVPFFKFIESWIFDGKYCDLFDEFLIDVSPGFLRSRDRSYYHRAYNLKEKYKRLLERGDDDDNNNEQTVDTQNFFLTHLYQSIFECGRNLTLLKLIDSNNVLCNRGDRINRPRLIVNMNLSYLQHVDETCQSYSNQIRSQAKYNFKTRKEYIDEQKLSRQKMLTRMQGEAAERLRQYEEKVSEERRAERERKNIEFDRLKEQLQVEMRRKKAEKDREKELDKEYMSKLVNKELMLTEAQRRMESELKEEITREYEELMTKAEQKEQMALKHVEQVRRKIQAIEENEEASPGATAVVDMDIDIKQDRMSSEQKSEEAEKMDISESDDFIERLPVIEPSPEIKAVDSAIPLVGVEKGRRVNDETVEKDYKPSIRIKSSQQQQPSPTDIGELGVVNTKPIIKLNEAQHHSKETDLDRLNLDMQRKLDAFKSRNTYGHSADSQIQDIIYSSGYANEKPVKSKETMLDKKSKQSYSSSSSTHTIKQSDSSASSSSTSSLENDTRRNRNKNPSGDDEENEIDAQQRLILEKFIHFTADDKRVESINFDQIIQPYDKTIGELFTASHRDQMISDLFGDRFALLPASALTNEFHDDFESHLQMEPDPTAKFQSFGYEYISVDEILNRILYKPIQTQLDLVNKSIIAHFLFDLKLDEHLAALRSYMFFENGEFAQTFVDHLLTSKGFESEHLLLIGDVDSESRIKSSHVTISPILINEAFNKAVSRVIKTCKYADNLSIRIDLSAESSHRATCSNSLMSFIDQFELVYKLAWPLNIIVNEASMRSYNQVFRFLLQIKLVLSVLNNVWHTVKRLTLVNKIGESRQIRQIKLFCHEMQHYLSALQSYIYNQVIQVAWDELQTKLNDAKCLEDLIEIHSSYLRNTLAKCFFTKKAEAVLSVIQNILKLIVKFRTELVGEQLVENPKTGDYEHAMFELLVETYQEFKKKSLFLYKILQKTVSVGHEFHLNNLALTLNYNDYYQQQL